METLELTIEEIIEEFEPTEQVKNLLMIIKSKDEEIKYLKNKSHVESKQFKIDPKVYEEYDSLVKETKQMKKLLSRIKDYIKRPDGYTIKNGKHTGKDISQVPDSWLDWAIMNVNFEPLQKIYIQEKVIRKYNDFLLSLTPVNYDVEIQNLKNNKKVSTDQPPWD